MQSPDDAATPVPSFITKLWKLVNEQKYADLIDWSPDGRSFTIKDQTRFAKQLLPMYFKHSNMGSFVRQLNMYGFRKIASIENCGLRPESDEVSFHHPHFVRGQELQLKMIRRKKSQQTTAQSDTKVNGNGSLVNGSTSQAVSTTGGSSDIQNQLVAIMQRQDSMEQFRMMMQQETAAIWKEIAFLRRQNSEQQNVIQNLIKFLISLVPQMRNMSHKRKASLVSNMAHSMPESKRLNTGSPAPSSSSSTPMDGYSLDQIRNGIMDAIRNGLSDTSETAGSPSGVMIQDVTNDDMDQSEQSGSSINITNNTIIAHASNSESQPMLTDSDMDLLSQICKQLNLMPPSGKKGSGRGSETVSAKNIVEVPEDFILSPDAAADEDDLSELVETAEELLFPAGGGGDGTDVPQTEDDKSQIILPHSPSGGQSLHRILEQAVEQPLNDPLGLDTLDLGVEHQDDFNLADLSTPLVEDSEESFSSLLL